MPATAEQQVLDLIHRRGLSTRYPPAVDGELRQILATPGLDDPALVDRTDLPLVTIDDAHSRDLDQALAIERDGDKLIAWYAIADAAWFVRPGTALYEEALARGASYYLPGRAVPMLPRALSEGLVSLNPDALRRAALFRLEVDPEGRCTHASVSRARVRSRAKLSFEGVQAWFDGGPSPTPDPRALASLALLPELGQRRMRATPDAIHYRRRELSVQIEDGRFTATVRPRNGVERDNEQLSLLVNIEGARLLARGRGVRGVQPVFRVHEPPDPDRLAELRQLSVDLARAHHLDPSVWAWSGQSLGAFLDGLPVGGPHGGIARALHRRAIMTNRSSVFQEHPGPHFGVGAPIYGRFSAPMREVVGIYGHQELWESLGAPPVPNPHRAAIIEAGNRARALQHKLDRDAQRLLIDQLCRADLALPPDARPAHTGVVMGITATRVHVSLDQPPADIKLYRRHGRLAGETDGATLRDGGRVIMRVGDTIRISVSGLDDKADRWAFRPVAFEPPASTRG